jgi:hypothetical protein
MGLVAHSGGLSWDELLLFASPVVILVVLQIIGRRRAQAHDPAEDARQPGDDADEGSTAGS